MPTLPAKDAARRLASELRLPSRQGVVMVAHRAAGEVLVVAVEERWLQFHELPKDYLGYQVEAGAPLGALAH